MVSLPGPVPHAGSLYTLAPGGLVTSGRRLELLERTPCRLVELQQCMDDHSPCEVYIYINTVIYRYSNI